MVELTSYLRALPGKHGNELVLTAERAPLYQSERALVPLPGEAPLSDAALRELTAALLGPELWELFRAHGSLSFTTEHATGTRLWGQCTESLRGLTLVLRPLPPGPSSCAALGMPQAAVKLAEQRSGLVVVAGPVQSGKTTALAALVDHALSLRGGHAVVVESAVEILRAEGRGAVSHRQVGAHCDSFARGIESALQSDCDVIAVSDLEPGAALEAALTAADSGVLVFGALRAKHAERALSHLRVAVPQPRRARVAARLERVLRGTIGPRVLPKKGGGRIAVYEVWTSGQTTGNRTLEAAFDEAVKQGLVDAADAKLL